MGHYHSSMSGFGFSLEEPESDDYDFEAIQEAGEGVNIHVEFCGDMVIGPARIFVTLADTFDDNGKIKVRSVSTEEVEILRTFAATHNLIPDEDPQWMTESYFG